MWHIKSLLNYIIPILHHNQINFTNDDFLNFDG